MRVGPLNSLVLTIPSFTTFGFGKTHAYFMEIAFQCKQYFDVCHHIHGCTCFHCHVHVHSRTFSSSAFFSIAYCAFAGANCSIWTLLLFSIVVSSSLCCCCFFFLFSFFSYFIFVTYTEFRRTPLISKSVCDCVCVCVCCCFPLHPLSFLFFCSSILKLTTNMHLPELKIFLSTTFHSHAYFNVDFYHFILFCSLFDCFTLFREKYIQTHAN